MISLTDDVMRVPRYRETEMDSEFGTPKDDDASNPSLSTDVSDEEGSITSRYYILIFPS